MTEGADLAGLVAAPGCHTVAYRDTAFPDRPILLHSARPERFSADTPVVFVHHGVRRNGADYRDYWAGFVDQADLLAIAIEFPEAAFPDYLAYHFGNRHAADGTANPPSQWTYGVVPRLFDRLRAQGLTASPRYGLFGHSAGGQFVHRMLSFGFRDRVAVAVCANAGTYAMPELETPWPFGLGDTGLQAEAVAALLRFPLTVMAGTGDTRTSGRFFPGGPRSMRQGAHRYERAHNYLRAGRHAAQRLRTECAWQVIDMPGVGHNGAAMSAAAVPVVAQALHAEAPR